mmetsp:Transcript_5157/g.17998  ORF Transcript_5157/g.17998 Transcript_5157/m.17998 type:complete len:280 (-) Transcript_5157:3301-4140(-)
MRGAFRVDGAPRGWQVCGERARHLGQGFGRGAGGAPHRHQPPPLRLDHLDAGHGHAGGASRGRVRLPLRDAGAERHVLAGPAPRRAGRSHDSHRPRVPRARRAHPPARGGGARRAGQPFRAHAAHRGPGDGGAPPQVDDVRSERAPRRVRRQAARDGGHLRSQPRLDRRRPHRRRPRLDRAVDVMRQRVRAPDVPHGVRRRPVRARGSLARARDVYAGARRLRAPAGAARVARDARALGHRSLLPAHGRADPRGASQRQCGAALPPEPWGGARGKGVGR